MTPQPNTPQPNTEETQHHRQLLNALIDQAATLATHIHAQALATTEPGELHEATRAFDRVARALRRTILLAQKLAEPRAAPRPATSTTTESRTAARKRIIRGVENAIDRTAANPREADALHAEFIERLEGPDIDADLDHLPVADIIDIIVRDLGLDNAAYAAPALRRTPAHIETLNTRATGRTPKPATPPNWTPKSRHPQQPPQIDQSLIDLATHLSQRNP